MLINGNGYITKPVIEAIDFNICEGLFVFCFNGATKKYFNQKTILDNKTSKKKPITLLLN